MFYKTINSQLIIINLNHFKASELFKNKFINYFLFQIWYVQFHLIIWHKIKSTLFNSNIIYLSMSHVLLTILLFSGWSTNTAQWDPKCFCIELLNCLPTLSWLTNFFNAEDASFSAYLCIGIGKLVEIIVTSSGILTTWITH